MVYDQFFVPQTFFSFSARQRKKMYKMFIEYINNGKIYKMAHIN